MENTIVSQMKLTGERALFAAENITVRDSVFEDGESPLKESSNIRVEGCIFRWKYPMWYSKQVTVEGSTLLDTARSGIWYTRGISLTDCTVDAPKTFRRSSEITLTRVDLNRAQETMWSCSDISMTDVNAVGDYFCMNSSDIVADNLTVSGNYAFDGCRNLTVKNSRLISKDAFWNCENVRVENSLIIGEYLGWNSKNVTLVNCTLESNQGLCYMEGVTLFNCKLINTDLAFEYSMVDAEVRSHIISVKNPLSGRIVADSIGQIIHEPGRVDTAKTEIKVRDK